MLKKLLKYELKATSRTFLPLYGCLLVFAVINRIFGGLQHQTENFSFFFGVSLTSYIFLIVAIFALTVFVMIQRFYKSLLGDEGYLMFTLPTTTGKLISSKLLVSIFWVIVSMIVTGISILILAMSTGFWKALGQVLRALQFYIKTSFSFADVTALASLLLMGLSALLFFILSVYCSIAVGHTFKRHRAIASVGAYLGITILTQFVTLFYLRIGSFILLKIPNLESYVLYGEYGSHLGILLWCVLYLCLAAVCYVVTQQILSKRLNLS